MTTTINLVVFLIATACSPNQIHVENADAQPQEIAVTNDTVLNAFDVDSHEVKSIGRIA